MLSLPAKITHSDADALARSLVEQVSAQSSTVVVEAQQLVDFDSSALAVLLACRRAALASGKLFAVNDLPSKLVQLASLYGVAQLLVPAPAIQEV